MFHIYFILFIIQTFVHNICIMTEVCILKLFFSVPWNYFLELEALNFKSGSEVPDFQIRIWSSNSTVVCIWNNCKVWILRSTDLK